MPTFHLRLSNEELTFRAGHFLVFADGQAELLHEHVYRVAAEVWGPLDANHCVVDFHAAEKALRSILAELDGRTLLPEELAGLRVLPDGAMIEIALAGNRRLLARENCRLLPLAATTTELLAQHVGRRWLALLSDLMGSVPERVRVSIDEGEGRSAGCDLP